MLVHLLDTRADLVKPLKKRLMDLGASINMCSDGEEIHPRLTLRSSLVELVVCPASDEEALARARAQLDQLNTSYFNAVFSVLIVTRPLIAGKEDELLEIGFDDLIIIEDGEELSEFQWTLVLKRYGSRRKHHLLKLFTEEVSDGLWLLDIRTDRVDWSPRACELHGLSAEQVPKSFDEFSQYVHPDDLDNVKQHLRRNIVEGTPQRSVIYRLANSGPNQRYIEAQGRVMRDLSGEPVMMVGTLRDVSAQRSLERERERYTKLFRESNDPLVLGELASRTIIDANPSALELLGVSRDELIASSWDALYDASSLEALEHALSTIDTQDTQPIPPLLLELASRDNTEAEVVVSLLDDAEHTKILFTLRDTTERRRVELVLRERDAQHQLASRLASLSMLAAGISHDINNPLAFLLGNLQLTAEELKELDNVPTDTIEGVEDALEGAMRIKQLIADLREYIRPVDDQTTCDPFKITDFATRVMSHQLRRSARLETDIDPSLPRVQLRGSELSHIIVNLLANACDAFGPNPTSGNTIRLSARRRGNMVEFVIEDNGCGMSPETLRRATESFFSTKPPQPGAGLGLSTSNALVRSSGGALQITSAVGEGTTVRFSVPSIELPEEIAPTDHTERKRATKILVIDDEPHICSLIKRMLTRRGFEVTTSNTPTEVPALLAKEEFDTILCDLMMPELDGRQLYELLADTSPRIAERFIFITGGGVTESLRSFEASMKPRILYKPLSPDLLLSRLGR